MLHQVATAARRNVTEGQTKLSSFRRNVTVGLSLLSRSVSALRGRNNSEFVKSPFGTFYTISQNIVAISNSRSALAQAMMASSLGPAVSLPQ